MIDWYFSNALSFKGKRADWWIYLLDQLKRFVKIAKVSQQSVSIQTLETDHSAKQN